MKFLNLFKNKIKKEKTKKAKTVKPDIAGPKKKSAVMSALLYALRVLWGAVKLVLILFILAGFVGGGLAAGLVYGYIQTTPDLDASVLQVITSNTFIFDSEGQVLAELKANENRVWIDYNEIPKNLINAFIAVEDKRFWDHKGVDFRRFIKSAYTSAFSVLKGDDTLQGGSTITQQLVKNLTGNKEATIKRKIQEVWQALKLERDGLSKEDILTRYLNIVPLGSTIYGIETAAQAYFGKDVRNLSLAECASIAGITQSPKIYTPNTEDNKQRNIERAHLILGLMLEQGLISQEEYDQAMQEEIKLIFNPGAGKITKTSIQTYFVEEVKKEVIRDLREKKGLSEDAAKDMLNNGLKIYTTLDPKVQSALDEVYIDKDKKYFPEPNEEAKLKGEIPQSAMVVMDPYTGAVKGLYGGYGKKEGDVYNRATQMARQPGSSIKPLLIYAPGIETSRITAATIIDDVPQYMRLNDTSIPEKERQKVYPRNVEKENFGLTTVHTGIVQSRNVVASLLLRDYTTFKVGLTYLERVGLPRWEDEGKISIAMGGFTTGMSPLQMAAAYSVFVYKGMYWKPYFYTRVEDYNGNVILEKNPEGTRVFSEQTSFIMNNMLQDVVKEGTAKGYGIKNKKGELIPTAGKTGTADSSVDKWFCGATPYYVAATWYGYDKNSSVTSSESSNALKIWNAVMSKIHEDLDSVPFFTAVPSKIVTRTICMDSGKLATDLCRQDPRGSRVTDEYFIEGTEPKYGEVCDVHYKAKICTSSKDEYGRPVLAHENCPSDTVKEQIFIRRPVEYKPVFPDEKPPTDWYYEIYEGEYCTVHDAFSQSWYNPFTEQPSPAW